MPDLARNTTLITASLEEVADMVMRLLEPRLAAIQSSAPETELVSREKLLEKLEWSHTTLNKYTQDGILKSYSFPGSRLKYYKWHEVIDALIPIER